MSPEERAETEKMVARLPESHHPHHAGNIADLGEWQRLGSPHCWEYSSSAHGVSVIEDSGYGLMAVFVDGEFKSITNHQYNDDNVVVLGTYWGYDSPKIFIAA